MVSAYKMQTWRGVRVVDGDALEMRFGSNVNGGSNPPLSDYSFYK